MKCKKELVGLMLIFVFLSSFGFSTNLFITSQENNSIENSTPKSSDFIIFTDIELEYFNQTQQLRDIDKYEEFSMSFDGGFWYVIQDRRIYKYDVDWNYITDWEIDGIQSPLSIFFYNNNIYILDVWKTIYQYFNTSGEIGDSWVYTGNSAYIGDIAEKPIDIYNHDGSWWILDDIDGIFEYTLGMIYTGNLYDIYHYNNGSVIDSTFDSILFSNGYWWVLGFQHKLIYKYYNDWEYTGYFFDVVFYTQDGSIRSISLEYDYFPNGTIYDTYLSIAGLFSKRVYKFNFKRVYNVYDDYNISFDLFDQYNNSLDKSYFSLYINGVEKNFGIVNINSQDVEIIVYENNFNVSIFNKTEISFFRRDEEDYNINSTIYTLEIIYDSTMDGNFTLTEKINYNSVNFTMIPDSVIEIFLGQTLYNATYFNPENNLTTIYNFNMNQNRSITLNSVLYNVNFTLTDQYDNQLDESKYSLYIYGIERNFEVIELYSENVPIVVYDRFEIIAFNQNVDLSGLSEYEIVIPIYEFEIEYFATEIGNFTLKEDITQKTYSFALNSNEGRTFKLSSANYTLTFLNLENLRIYIYNITLDSDYTLVINSSFYNVYFSIFGIDGIGLDNNFFRFYVNGIRKTLGNVELNVEDNDLLILDFFNNVIYNETVNLSDKTEYNIYVEMYTIEIRNAYNYAIDLVFERNNMTVNITIPAQFSLEYRFILNIEYNITWYKSSDGSYVGNTEIEFTKENLIISFGVVASISSNTPKNNIFTILLVSSVIGVVLFILGLCVYIKKRKRKNSNLKLKNE